MQQAQQNADLLIDAGWVLTVAPADSAIPDATIAIKDGCIVAVLDREKAADWSAPERVSLPGHALLPGLVNAHGHAAMTLLRGYADDLPLMPWLEEHIWPVENAIVSDAFVRAGSALAMAEMLLSGTTCYSDMYFFPDAVAETNAEAGLRCQLAAPVFDFPTAWGNGPDEYISKVLELRDEYKNQPLITVAFGPHAPYTVSVPTLEKIAIYAAELDMGVHIHLHETAGEVLSAVEATGQRPIDSLRDIGLLGPRTQCVHMTDLGRQDIQSLADTGAQVIHCPQSNMKLGSGICPVPDLLQAGVNVALGTDGAASNNDLNLFNEMHSTALLAKVSRSDPTLMPAPQVLEMATLGGARALGLDAHIGTISVGKQADLIAVDLSGPAMQPLYNPISQIVYAANGSEVTHAWVRGRELLRDRNLTTINLKETLAEANAWGNRIRQIR